MPALPLAPRPLDPALRRLMGAALAAGFFAQVAAPAPAAEPALTGKAVNDAEFDPTPDPEAPERALVTKLQVLLDREGFSVGVIDGFLGDNVVKAIEALEFAEGLKPDGRLDPDVWATLAAAAIAPAMIDYEITPQDVAGPFIETVPKDFAELAKLERIAYTGPLELLAERFHMDEDLLVELNPGKDFARPGTVVVVADPGEPLSEPTIETIEVDGKAGLVRAFDAEGLLAAFYPATVGSRENPGPTGTHKVRTLAIEPSYTYDPKVNFVSGDGRKKLELPPGPNGPVGTVRIGLTESTCGIHGTAGPSKIDKEWSHGCVRLTNWDAHELAQLVRAGSTVVKFLATGEVEGASPLEPSGTETAAQ